MVGPVRGLIKKKGREGKKVRIHIPANKKLTGSRVYYSRIRVLGLVGVLRCGLDIPCKGKTCWDCGEGKFLLY